MSNVSSLVEGRSARRLHDRRSGVDGRSLWASKFRRVFDSVCETQKLDATALTLFQKNIVRSVTSLNAEQRRASASQRGNHRGPVRLGRAAVGPPQRETVMTISPEQKLAASQRLREARAERYEARAKRIAWITQQLSRPDDSTVEQCLIGVIAKQSAMHRHGSIKESSLRRRLAWLRKRFDVNREAVRMMNAMCANDTSRPANGTMAEAQPSHGKTSATRRPRARAPMDTGDNRSATIDCPTLFGRTESRRSRPQRDR